LRLGNCGPLRGDPVPGYGGELKTLYLLQAHQRRGIGRGLFCRLVMLLAERRDGSAIAWVLAGNPAFAFYEAMGGKLCAQRADEVFGAVVEEIGYGWTDLPALARRATAGVSEKVISGAKRATRERQRPNRSNQGSPRETQRSRRRCSCRMAFFLHLRARRVSVVKMVLLTVSLSIFLSLAPLPT
jgi:hypothetical protein